MLVRDEELADAVRTDYRTARLSPADRALLDYVAKLTLTPAEMSEDDVRELREHGFSDGQTLHAVAVCGLFNNNDRIADGTGLTNADLAGLADR